MHLAKPEAYQLTLDKELLEDWIDRDAREREVIADNQYMKINSLELVNGIVVCTIDIYEEYLN
jgi:hypothetical protein